MLVEKVIDPGKLALAGTRVMLFYKTIDNLIGQAVSLHHHHPLCLCIRRRRQSEKQTEQAEQN